MKTLLIRPPARSIAGSAKPSISLPLGLLYLGAVLEKNGYDIDLYDAQVNLKNPVTLLEDNSTHIGDSWSEFREKVKKYNPDIVGINSSFTVQHENAIRAAEIVKEVGADILVVVGGNHASARPEDFFLKTKAVNIVCIGEAEYTILNLVEKFKKGEPLKDIAGTAIRAGKEIKINQNSSLIDNLDELPFPAYHLINLEDYFSLYKKGFGGRPGMEYPGSERSVSLITSRGCPFNCVFCSIHIHMGRKWRFHSPEYIKRYLGMLSRDFDVNHIHFEDDNLTCDINRFKKILRTLKEDFPHFTWDTPNGVRVDTLTKEVIKDSAVNGCRYLIFGVESGNQEVLTKIIGKQLDLNKVEEAAIFCKKAHIDTEAFFVIGFPGETPAQMQETVDYALRLQRKYDVNPGIFVATPLPGTRLERLCLEKSILKSPLPVDALAKMTQGAFIQDGDTFKAQDIKQALELFYKGYKRIFLINSLLFFLTHPVGLFRFILKIIKEKKIDKQNIINILQYKKSLLRKLNVKNV